MWLSSELINYFYSRALELCQELNLPSGVAYHEKCAGRMLLTEQEQAKWVD